MFGGRKKKKDSPKPRQRQPKTTESTTSIEDILRELTGESATPRSEPKPRYEPDPEPVNHREEPLETIEPEITYSKDGDYAHTSEKMRAREIVDFVQLEEDEEDRASIEIDLRQAVIYDAILHRPYE